MFLSEILSYHLLSIRDFQNLYKRKILINKIYNIFDYQ